MIGLQELDLRGGWHVGPLFVIVKRRQNPRLGTRAPGTVRRRSERRATPAWVDKAAMRALFLECKRITRLTGVQHSRDHIVPLHNPIVCGLNVPWNIRIIPLSDNLRKSNGAWPGMPLEQLELL